MSSLTRISRNSSLLSAQVTTHTQRHTPPSFRLLYWVVSQGKIFSAFLNVKMSQCCDVLPVIPICKWGYHAGPFSTPMCLQWLCLKFLHPQVDSTTWKGNDVNLSKINSTWILRRSRRIFKNQIINKILKGKRGKCCSITISTKGQWTGERPLSKENMSPKPLQVPICGLRFRQCDQKALVTLHLT